MWEVTFGPCECRACEQSDEVADGAARPMAFFGGWSVLMLTRSRYYESELAKR